MNTKTGEIKRKTDEKNVPVITRFIMQKDAYLCYT